jgi:hypothetical protein
VGSGIGGEVGEADGEAAALAFGGGYFDAAAVKFGELLDDGQAQAKAAVGAAEALVKRGEGDE